jgi:hypothetical protein
MNTTPNRLLAAIVGAVLVAALASIAITSSQQNAELRSGSPEWVVQSYLVAMFDGETDKALAFLADSSPCNITHLDQAWINSNTNIDLLKSEISGATAKVEIAAEFGNSDLFNSSYVESHTYRLEKVLTEWLITGIPWPVYDCGVISK